MAPRIAQAVTAALCIEAILFDTPGALLVALALVLVSLVAPKWSPIGWLARRVLAPARELEPAAPTRFSQWLAVVFLAAASLFVLTGPAVVGWTIAAMVAALALLSATTGICVGCNVYRLVLARRAAQDGVDHRELLGLSGTGPWLVVLTAPGCSRCEPTARELEALAGGRDVQRVDLTKTPGAAGLPVRSVPAVLAVDADGSLRMAKSGRLDRTNLTEVAAAV